ncbi:MAG: synthase subcomplex delta subunit [Betaproteobacteria bacterium]|jgi:F-type H+-transporting ATPase subunit delta|nr:synthase subcomplex delta subunit [Betaproteobacteria bacterium]MEA3158180.1 F-type H+-transporting ATPase subunit delta [Betaproteobacteria bacterium]HEV7393951.1 F0F1 ATP synthase subunit delta [Burkholderiales bacterium]
MAELVTIARPYAEAAFKLALENKNLAGWSDMLSLLEAVVRDERVASRIGDPNVTDRALESLLLGAFGDRLDGQGRNFVQILIQNQRLELVPHIRTLYEELRREHEGVVEARIVSAMPIGDEQVQQLLAALEKKYGRKVNAQVEVDAALIGGARIVVGDKVIDATVRGRLDAMAAALAQ